MLRARTRAVAWVALIVPLLASCRREERTFRPEPSSAEAVRWTGLSELHPGPDGYPPRPTEPEEGPYEESAYAVSEGKRLYSAFNCVGCHARGGGGMGPPLMDDTWIYGHRPEQVFATIVEGRPNGMPQFGGRIPAYQVWWLVAYVRSMSGLLSGGASPSRGDEMKSGKPEASRERAEPKESSLPKGAEIPQ